MNRFLTIISFIATIILGVASADAQKQDAQKRVPPNHADVKYGPHERHVFDVWLPENANAASQLPVFVWFHGGGFVAGDKSAFNPTPFLQAGMAVVSANYRFVDGEKTLCPVPQQDGARVIQTLRAHADEWNIDESRIAVSGSSAGAVITAWIGYHDDLADADSRDPVSRLSTRVKCIVPLDGPTNLDPKWVTPNLGGPKSIHSSFPKMFGVAATDTDRPAVRKRILESSPIEHLTQDDPPTLMIYGGKLEGIPLPEDASQGVLVHHPYFGKALKQELDTAGIPNELHYGIEGPAMNSIILPWLRSNL